MEHCPPRNHTVWSFIAYVSWQKRSNPCFYWQQYYHKVLLQWYLRRESYSRLLPPHFAAICLTIKFLAIFGHFLPFVPSQRWLLDPTSAFIDENVITGCCCIDIYGERAISGYYHPIFSPFAWKWNFFVILSYFSPFVPALGQPNDLISASIDKNLIIGYCCKDI